MIPSQDIFSKLITFLPLFLLSIIGFFLYKKFNSPEAVIDRANEKLAYQNSITTEASQANTLNSMKKNLEKSGLVVGTLHTSIANELHQLIDAVIVDEKAIVKKVLSINANSTFQLVNTAYGQREINTWRNWHIFDANAYKSMFTGKNLYGDLKSHLLIVLDESQQKEISSRLKLI